MPRIHAPRPRAASPRVCVTRRPALRYAFTRTGHPAPHAPDFTGNAAAAPPVPHAVPPHLHAGLVNTIQPFTRSPP